MRHYVEMTEIMTDEESLEGQPIFARREVANKGDALITVADLRPMFDGLPYRAVLHTCRHEESPNEPCAVETLEELTE